MLSISIKHSVEDFNNLFTANDLSLLTTLGQSTTDTDTLVDYLTERVGAAEAMEAEDEIEASGVVEALTLRNLTENIREVLSKMSPFRNKEVVLLCLNR